MGSPVFKKRGKGLFLSPCHGVFCLPLNIALPKVQGFSHSKCRPSQGAPAGGEHPVTQSPGCVPSPPTPHVLAQVTAWGRATVLAGQGQRRCSQSRTYPGSTGEATLTLREPRVQVRGTYNVPSDFAYKTQIQRYNY